jgi:hypothetical protein
MSQLKRTNEILAREIHPYSVGDNVTEVAVSFTPRRTRRALPEDPATAGGGFYLVYDQGLGVDGVIVYIGATVRLRLRAYEHIVRNGFQEDWTYRVAYPDEALGALLYPYALAFYRTHGDADRTYHRRGLTPEEAACLDTRPPHIGERRSKRGDLQYRLESLMLRWYWDQYGRFPRKNSADTQIYRRRPYLRDIQIRMEGDRAIVSGTPQQVSGHHLPAHLSGKRGR